MSATLLFLTHEDFFLGKGAKGSIMCTDIRGFSLVLFYSTQCEYCQQLIPIFKRLPDIVSGCQFAMINISKNRQLINLARNTIAPLQYVPYVVLYIDGKPYMRYDGPHDENQIRQFILEVANQIQQKPNFAPSSNGKKELPAYTIGNPLCGDNEVCYLEYDDAYIDDKKKGK